MRILLIARAYPPTVGGMEQFAFQLRRHLGAHAQVEELINRGGKRALPAFLPTAAARAVASARRGRIDVVHLADALLAPVGAIIKRASGVPVTASVCGLDVTYAHPLYQAIVPRSLRELDLVMPISGATEAAMRARTGPRPQSRVIPLGVNPLPAALPSALEEFDRLAGMTEGQRIILTVGRLIERKGVEWFVRAVLPRLGDDVVYLVVGEGPARGAIERAARGVGLAGRVRLTGRVQPGVLAAAYARADVFVMPNIPVAGDIEGFGLVALEAASAGVPVVAAALDGIEQAIVPGENGVLVPPLEPAQFAAGVNALLALGAAERGRIGARFRDATLARFGWDATAAAYVEAIASAMGARAEAPARAA
jgi:glycosyltransferase involved in cell wall biosynthesis